MSSKLAAQQERLAAIVNRFSQRRVVVVGDLVADQFLYGEISRVSREAPVLILRHERTETTPGGAANCAANLAALGARVSLIGVVGEDEAGLALVEKLCAVGVDCHGVASSKSMRTTTKVRILAGQAHSPKQQVIRVDYDGEPSLEYNEREQLARHLQEEIQKSEAVIISDYNYGVVEMKMAALARYAADQLHIPVLVDSRFRLAEFKGFTSATPNEDEAEQLYGKPLKDDAAIMEAGMKLRERLNFRTLLITRGGHGMMLFEEGEPPLQIEAVGAHEPVDVTGAGDTVIATYTLALSSGASFADAAHLANYAGGLVVMKRGTASVSREELLESVSRWEVNSKDEG